MEQAILARDAELAAVRSFLARADGSVSLVLEGVPGIGKTALWTEAIAQARAAGFVTLEARTAESEVRLSYAALADLVEPVPEEVLLSLPAAQRDAVDAALLRGERAARGSDLRSVAAGVRTALLALAETAPVVLAVADLQWLDAASAAALGFALRRVAGAPVKLVATRRAESGQEALVLEDEEVLRLEPLSLAAIHRLLKDRLGCSLPRPLLVRVYEACEGNPFYALDIGRELLRVDVGPGDALPVPSDLRRLVRRRIGRLSPATRETLLVAASTTSPSARLLQEALGRDPAPALDEAEDAGVLEVDGDSLRFAHPLYAAAISASAPAEQRRQVHRRLADVADGLEERAWHLGLAVDAPSDDVAETLERAAVQARERGATAAAAELFARAVDLTPPGSELRLARHRGRAECLFESGNTAAAVASLELLCAEAPPGALRADALLMLATILWFDDEPRAVELARQALAEAPEPRQRGTVHARLSWLVQDVEESRIQARSALELLDEDEDSELYAFALLNWGENEFHSGNGDHAEHIARGRELQGADLRWDYSTIPACWAKEMDRLEEARAEFELYVRRAEELGDDSSLATHLVHLAEISLWLGEWDRAEREARDSLALAEQTGQRSLLPVARYANDLVDAHRGRSHARTRIEDAAGWFGGENDESSIFVDVARGFVAFSEGEYEAADRAFTRADALLEARGMVEPARWRFHPDHVEAVVACGELDRAQELLRRLQTRGETVPRPWIVGASARCEALLSAACGDSERALEAAERACAVHAGTRLPFELARDWLVKGQVERRAKRKAAAKESLTRAAALFEELGAPVWLERARAELSRVGLRPPARDDLTETERRVAELAAAGLKNREVAAKLFLSPKTVDANLSRVYRKLGIRSRAELGAKLGNHV